jgi:hypothetical protein
MKLILKNKCRIHIFTILSLILILCISSCNGPQKKTDFSQIASLRPLGIIGGVEKVALFSPDLVYEARIDTGAQTSSLDARDIDAFQYNKKPWVRFKIIDPRTLEMIEVERPVERIVHVKRKDAESRKRYVVLFDTQIGKLRMKSEFTLVDRDNFGYHVLIGRNILQGQAVVDVGLTHVLQLDIQP